MAMKAQSLDWSTVSSAHPMQTGQLFLYSTATAKATGARSQGTVNPHPLQSPSSLWHDQIPALWTLNFELPVS